MIQANLRLVVAVAKPGGGGGQEVSGAGDGTARPRVGGHPRPGAGGGAL
jgi:hypothetical protein